MCNSGIGHYRVHLCEMYFECGSVVQKIILKRIILFSALVASRAELFVHFW